MPTHRKGVPLHVVTLGPVAMRVLLFLCRHVGKAPPSWREISAHMGWESVCTRPKEVIEELEKHGLVRRERKKARTVVVTCLIETVPDHITSGARDAVQIERGS